MSFELLACTVMTVMGVSILAEFARAERLARDYMLATVARHGQYEQLAEICAQTHHLALQSTSAVGAQRPLSGLRCRTAIYWIENAATWVNMCEHLSVAKTRPLRWFLVATHCEASWLRPLWSVRADDSRAQDQAATQTVESSSWIITHWLAKS